jgi:hypothetical protein
MALIATNKPLTLAEANKISGNIELGNILADFQTRNSFLDEAPWISSTHGSHTEEYRAVHLEGGEFISANGGYPVIGSTGEIVKEPVRLYGGKSRVNDNVLKSADDPHRVRDAYDTMNLEGILQDFNRRILEAVQTPSDPDSFDGFCRRRAAVDNESVFSAGGTGTGLTSAWLMELGPRGVHLVYGKNFGSVGITSEDEGKVHVQVDGKDAVFWQRKYDVNAGIVVPSKRCLIRYANIDPDATGTGKFDPLFFIRYMKNRLSDPSGRSAILFVNRVVYGQIEAAAFDKGNLHLTMSDFQDFGPVLKIAGVIVRPWDAISENESEVPAAA